MKKLLPGLLTLALVLTACGGTDEKVDTRLTDELLNNPDLTIGGSDAPLDPADEPVVTGPTTAPPSLDSFDLDE